MEYTAAVDVENSIPFDFTAPEDGAYTVAATGEGNYSVGAYDQDGGYRSPSSMIHKRGIRCVSYEMKAGETFRYQLYNENKFETEFCFVIGKDVPATGMTLPFTERSWTRIWSWRFLPSFWQTARALRAKPTAVSAAARSQ